MILFLGEIGITLNVNFDLPKNKSSQSDLEAAETGRQFEFGWFASPVLQTGWSHAITAPTVLDIAGEI